MGDRWRVEVDRGVCIAAGMCVGTAPEAFRLDGARQSHPVAEVTDASEDILAAAESCPVEAISIRLTESDEAVFPPDD
ncbi:ferredoxin [Streptomyces sp. A7024]|uniref:Ferredoxin n=1 Tax=Streptomyces coryli TaxID=1128680 RepID=A0A6G4UCX4_9ACTN|nr:ferredoxin [Streptomyces coryli]NGN69228.1 ferredoxin [Streptomyces coryli]